MSNVSLVNLKDAGCPIDSVFEAARYVNQFANKEWSKSRFELLIKTHFGVDASTSFDKEAEVLYRYMVTEAVRHAVEKTEINEQQLLQQAKTLTDKFFVKFPWFHPSHQSQLAKSNLDENGNYIGEVGFDDTVPVEEIRIERKEIGGKVIKPKKGAKQAAAQAIYAAHKDKPNAEIISMFMSQLDMSKAGATTYLYNLKKANAGVASERITA